MGGKFELYQDVRGQWRFRLKTDDGRIVCVGDAYGTKAAALEGIEQVRRGAAADLVDLTLVNESG